MRSVRSFDDQDSSRFNVAKITARAVEDILYVLDSATAPNGSNGVNTFSENEVLMYQEFRKWFGPQVGASIQGLVVGPLLSSIDILGNGLINVVPMESRAFEDTALTIEGRTKARLLWLTEEVPSLIDAYKQLEIEEEAIAKGVVANVISFLEGDFDLETASELLADAEKWFMFSQPGAKILRGDQEAIDALMELTTNLRREIDSCESDRKKARLAIESGSVGQDDLEYATDELHRVEAEISKHEEALSSLDKQRVKIIESISRSSE